MWYLRGTLSYGTRHGYLFELTGGRLCLDLANTKDERPAEQPLELLCDYTHALDWAVQAGVLSRPERRRLNEYAVTHRVRADEALRRLIDGREAIFEVFSAIARQEEIPRLPLRLLNDLVARTASGLLLVQGTGRLQWAWRPTDAPNLDRPLDAAVWSARELLTSDELSRVRQCEGAGCAWLFMDTSKNATRRWCDMSVCGNRAKVRRHRSRPRRAAPR
jgi:predicted RNA-binding Zn ribbon-like protein